MNQSILQRAASYYRDRKRREQYFIIAGALIMYSLVLFVVFMTFKGNIDETRSQLNEYETALDTLTTIAPDYLKKKSQQGGSNPKLDQFSDDKLKGNNIQLRSFVAGHAQAADFSFDSYERNTQQLGSGGDDDEGPSITEIELTADIREVEYSKLIELLKRIESTDKPAYVYRLRMTQYRNRPGIVRATVYVSTFRIPESESS